LGLVPLIECLGISRLGHKVNGLVGRLSASRTISRCLGSKGHRLSVAATFYEASSVMYDSDNVAVFITAQWAPEVESVMKAIESEQTFFSFRMYPVLHQAA
jgi:hypothetical protein